ncbi:MAG: non-ribosomal peptide synthetase, partial [Hyphomicrobiales bacterium]
MHDNFFELGGHSLLAVQLASAMRQKLGVDVALSELFARPTLGQYAQAVALAGASALPPIEVRGEGELAVQSFAQQRLWFLDQLDKRAGAAYHVPVGVTLGGPLDEAALRRSLDTIVQRHEVLRTSFSLVDGQPVQTVNGTGRFALVIKDLSTSEDPQAQALQEAREEASEPFDLATGPLVRGRLLKLADNEHVLLATMHHIVSDGWSMGVLVRELGALYAAFSQGQDNPLPPLAIQYADYAVWQRRWLSGD